MKTKLWILLTALATVALFAGCGKQVGNAAPGKLPAVSGEPGSKPTIAAPSGKPPTNLVIKDIKVGSGATAESGDKVSVQYVGISWSTGAEFDASWDRGKAFGFELGPNAQVIQGWNQGVEGMKVGGRRLLVIPPNLGYGAQGSPPSIAPNETLVFVIDLLKVTKPKT